MGRLPETERDFQAAVLELARWCGWLCYHTHDSRRSPAGFPDLVLARDGQLILAELKAERGRLSAEQEQWLHELGAVESRLRRGCRPGERPLVLVRLWTPADWPEIERQLRARPEQPA